MIVISASIVIIALLTLYGVWRVRYRYPAEGSPQALCYHKISDRFCFEGTWTTPNRFFAHIDFLSERGYRFLSENEFLDGLDHATGIAPAIFLTFDDGYQEIYQFIMPGLAERGIPFHVFVVTDYAGRSNGWDLSLGRRPFWHMSWAEIEAMAAQGVTFGSHGQTHRDLTRLTEEECLHELANSKKAIENRINSPVRSFSYPFGRYNAAIQTLARRAGYQAAFSVYPSHANEHVDRFALRRNGIYIIDTRGSILRKLERRPLSWFEEMKCRSINGFAVLTPMLKTFSRNRDK
ncbi:MAG: polysaccharide deacetylase family protein [Candidatus Latescibacterota bacterium]